MTFKKFWTDENGKIHVIKIASNYDTRKISSNASSQPSVIEKPKDAEERDRLYRENYNLQRTVGEVLRTGQEPTFPKGTILPDITNVVGVDESGNRVMDFSGLNLSQKSISRIERFETDLQKQLDDFSVDSLKDLESLYDPMSYNKRRQTVVKMIPKQEGMKNLILNYGNQIKQGNMTSEEFEKSGLRLEYPPVRKAKEFLVSYHSDEDLRELPNSWDKKSDAEKKEISDYYKAKTLSANVPRWKQFKGKLYDMKKFKIISPKGEEQKIVPRTGEERKREFLNIGKGRPYFIQTLNGVRILGFRDQFSAENFGYNYLTQVDKKTGNVRWKDIAKSKEAKLIVQKLKENVSKKAKKDIRDVNLRDIAKYYPPSIWFWTDNVAKVEGTSLGKKPRQLVNIDARRRKLDSEAMTEYLEAQEKMKRTATELTNAEEKMKERELTQDQTKRGNKESLSLRERIKANRNKRQMPI